MNSIALPVMDDLMGQLDAQITASSQRPLPPENSSLNMTMELSRLIDDHRAEQDAEHLTQRECEFERTHAERLASEFNEQLSNCENNPSYALQGRS